jgi:WD40 repeat protein
VQSVAFAPDGRTLATGSEDRTVRVWNLTDPLHPRSRSRLTGYTDGVMSVAFAPGGRAPAAASSDEKVRLYSLTTRGEAREPVLLTAHTKPVEGLAFSPDRPHPGRRQPGLDRPALGPRRRTRRLRICATAFPTVTRTEWRQYFPQWKYRQPGGS